MRVQLDAAVHDENVSRLHNLLVEKTKEHEVLQTENRLLERQLQQLQPVQDEHELSEQRALSDEQAQLTARMKKYQQLHRMDEQRRQKLQKEYSKASLRMERLRRELKAEQVRHRSRPLRRSSRAVWRGRGQPSACPLPPSQLPSQLLCSPPPTVDRRST